ncbi:DUF2231 domain-containing protein [Spirosoma utsteinense]|uniref:Membrane protein n=1 Tax=Spirosoma utsteinense TaxID=2585773 RepID=A0ABR6W9G8_9BACT|nr:DUF2231 domain-containing protein [Spirosoma utsteinense]MBC3787612.1 putative membrane protein [Spirosoma utsteinense]MBC3793208.1 putative membrane protein [Spirosoma utsteinense]
MESRAKLAGHAAHPILIVFPLGLLATATIFDIVYLLNDNSTFVLVSYWMIVSGLVGGLLAAVPGWIDWFAIPAGTRAKRIGLVHGLGNVAVLLLFGLSWLFRRDEAGYVPSILALVASFIAFALAGFTGWLGGELVDRLGVGVDNGAHLNSPNSLSGRPAAGIDGAGGHITDVSGRERLV